MERQNQEEFEKTEDLPTLRENRKTLSNGAMAFRKL